MLKEREEDENVHMEREGGTRMKKTTTTQNILREQVKDTQKGKKQRKLKKTKTLI